MRLSNTALFIIIGVLVFYALLNNDERTYRGIAPDIKPKSERPTLLSVSSFTPIAILEMAEAETASTGTAFAIDDRGHYLTARHVIEGCKSVTLLPNDGPPRKAERVSPSASSDLALLETSLRHEPLPLDLSDNLRKGDPVFAFGYPQARPGEVLGVLAMRKRIQFKGTLYAQSDGLEVDVTQFSYDQGGFGGLSGGPVLNEEGHVIGVAIASAFEASKMTAISPNEVKGFLDHKGIRISLYDRENTAQLDFTNAVGKAKRLRRANRIIQIVCHP